MFFELLNLCGFEPDEIEKQKPRIERTFDILEIGSDDVRRGTERIKKYFDTDLIGMRKVLGLWIRELIDMVLAKQEGKRVVCVSYPPVSEISAALALASEDIYCASPDVVLNNTLNLIFDKINPVLETAEKHGLPPGIAFCSYLQTRLGAIAKGIIPMPDLLIPSCYMCDLTPETDQLLHELYGIPVAYIDNIMDVKGEEWPEVNPRKVRYLAAELESAMGKFSQLFDLPVQEGEIREAIETRNRLYAAISRIRELAQRDPIPLGQNNCKIINDLASSCIKRGLQDGVGILNVLRGEVEKRVDEGKGVVERGAPMVLVSMLPYDPTFADLIEKSGLAIYGTSTIPTPSASGRSSYTSLWEQIAETLMKRRGGQYSSWAYIIQLKELAQLSHVKGFIFWTHYSCRQYSIFPLKAKEIIEAELNIPVLLLEGDYCDFRSYTTEQMSTKIETFAEMVKALNSGGDHRG
jgi:benzoyl-CoA reductase/2-hydroxyglutaryl-CoA dehydratase subunit BcrC/BadD/HgdB